MVVALRDKLAIFLRRYRRARNVAFLDAARLVGRFGDRVLILLIALFLSWTSPRPIDPASVQITITGGALNHAVTFLGNSSGEAWIDAPRECATIDWTAKTRDGVTLHTIHAYRDGCDKFYVPLL